MRYRLSDIIVWGVITTYSVAKPLIRDYENVRLATKEEVRRYLNRPEK